MIDKYIEELSSGGINMIDISSSGSPDAKSVRKQIPEGDGIHVVATVGIDGPVNF